MTGTRDKKIVVAIADDHPLVLSGVVHMLSANNEVRLSHTYKNGQELMQGLAREQPDVLLLDIHMPGTQGDELAEMILKSYPDVKILALTNLDSVYYIKLMLRKGVRGYILKTTEEDVLLEGIREVYNGELYLSPTLKEKVAMDALQTKRQLMSCPILSSREKEVLQFIASDLTSQEIASKLFVSKSAIDNHRLNLLMKLGVKNVAALVKKAIQLGLID